MSSTSSVLGCAPACVAGVAHRTAGGWLALALMALGSLAATGCHSMSEDVQVIRSTRDQPTNVTVIDTHRSQTIWCMEVPVDHEQELDFSRSGDRRGRRLVELPPTRMDWSLREIDSRWGGVDRDLVPGPSSGGIDLPGNPVLTQVELRQTRAVSADAAIESEPDAQAETETAATQAAQQ